MKIHFFPRDKAGRDVFLFRFRNCLPVFHAGAVSWEVGTGSLTTEYNTSLNM